MDGGIDLVVVGIALAGSLLLAGILLTRARRRSQPEQTESGIKIPATASRRQRRILESLEPDPEIPTLMDLVREEITELGIEDIPGHEDISSPVLLKVFRRDGQVRENCPHKEYGYVVAEGVNRKEATESQVRLYCEQCGEANQVAEIPDE